MYSFEPSDEQKMLMDAVNRFATNDLRPAARPADESGELPRSLIGKGWELGVLQASIPEAYGGFGERSAVTGALAAEELAFGDLSARVCRWDTRLVCPSHPAGRLGRTEATISSGDRRRRAGSPSPLG